MSLSDNEIIDYLVKFDDYIKVTDWAVSIFRKGMWEVLRGMGKALDLMTGGQKKVLKMLDFYNSETVQEFIKPFEPLVLGISSLAVVYVCYCAMNDKETNMTKIIKNLLTGFLLFIGLPLFMSTASQLSTLTANQISVAQQSSLTTFQTNIVDLYTVDTNNWKLKDNNNDIKKKKDLQFLKISEVVDTGSGGIFGLFETSPLSDDGRKILDKQVLEVNGEKKLAKLDDFFLKKQSYFRYSWHPWYMIVELVCKIVVAYFLIYKLVRIIQELGLLATIMHFSALSDLKTGQRNAKMMTQLANTFVVIVIIFLIQAFYDLLWVYVKSFDFSNLLNLGIMIPLTLGVIDGPNFVEQFFGIDAGLSSAGQGLFTMIQSGYAMKSLGSGAKSLATSAGKMGAKVGKSATGLGARAGAGIKGALDGFKENMGNSSGNPSGADSGAKRPTIPESMSNEQKKAKQGQKELQKDKKQQPTSQSKEKLEGRSGPKPPTANGNSFPASVNSAKKAMEGSMEGRQPTTNETMKDRMVGKYADTAKKADNSPFMQRNRQSYDVGKNTIKSLNKKRGDN